MSYNNIELVSGVAEERGGRPATDICKDAATLSRMSAMAKATDTPTYPTRRTLSVSPNGLCKTVRGPPSR